MEYNGQAEMATRLHVVTLHRSGKPNIHTEEIEGDLRKDDALKILKKSEGFSRAFINSDRSGFKSILVHYAGAAVTNDIDPEKYGCLGIPANIGKLAANSEERFDFAALACGYVSRTLRHALSLPIYGVDPLQGLAQGGDDVERAVKAFADEKGKSVEESDPLLNLERISTPDELHGRLQRLAELDAYLEKHLSVESESDSYQHHLRFSSIPLRLLKLDAPDYQYAVLSMTCLGTVWSRTADGDFVLTAMGVASAE